MYLDKIIPFVMKTKVIHGLGTINCIPEECKQLGISKAIIVTDEGLVKAGTAKEIIAVLEKAKIPHVVYDKVEIDPCMKTVHEGERLRQEEGCDGVIILGGGSVLCAGKGIAILGTNGGKMSDYQGRGKIKHLPLPVIAIPTTAGSGSEVSPVFLITNEETRVKMSIGSDLNFPPTAILDPNLLRSLPERQAIWSSLDALTHAVEALCTNMATPLTDCIALRAIQMMFQNLLPSIFTDNMEAKSEQLLASTMANIACGNAKLGLAHAFSHPFRNLDIPHGLACGLMLPFVMEYNLPACKPQLAQMALAIGENPDQTIDTLAYRSLERVKNLYIEAGFPTRLTENEVPKGKVEEVAKEAAGASQIKFNIRRTGLKELTQILDRAYDGF